VELDLIPNEYGFEILWKTSRMGVEYSKELASKLHGSFQ
jgi:hypothetical protein